MTVARANGLALPDTPTMVVKVGSSSITKGDGRLDAGAITRLCDQIAEVRSLGTRVVLVSSGAIAAGLPLLGFTTRPSEIDLLQAVSAVGQVQLMDAYSAALAQYHGTVAQVLLTRHIFAHRGQYLQARATLARLIDLGVLPIVNENDTVADDEIRFGENDRLSALVAHLVDADVLVLLTDQPGLFDADPRLVEDATLIDEVHALDEELDRVAGGAGSPFGSGGMASKVAAAKMAAHSGVATVIADAGADDVLLRVRQGEPAGTIVRPHGRRLSSRKLWIAFAQAPAGRLGIDAGAARALVRDGGSLLAVGVVSQSGDFVAGDPVEISDPDGDPVAKGLVRVDARTLGEIRGTRDAPVVVHRDDLVVLR